MKVRSESTSYHFVALLLPSWSCEKSKCEIAFFFCIWYKNHFANCVCMYVGILIMAFSPEVALVDCSAPAALHTR